MYRQNSPISVELCAGAGGQALGLEQAGFEPEALVEIDAPSCATLRLNRPNWNVLEEDLVSFDARPFYGADLVAAGLPCPPFSKAGKQLGAADERNLFPSMIRVVNEIRPQAVMIENVRGFLDPAFAEFRAELKSTLYRFGYVVDWKLFNTSDFGVSQLRPRVVIVAVKKNISECFEWPAGVAPRPPTVGELLYDLMAENGWEGAAKWRLQAGDIAPTLVGGSKKARGAGPRTNQGKKGMGCPGR